MNLVKSSYIDRLVIINGAKFPICIVMHILIEHSVKKYAVIEIICRPHVYGTDLESLVYS